MVWLQMLNCVNLDAGPLKATMLMGSLAIPDMSNVSTAPAESDEKPASCDTP